MIVYTASPSSTVECWDVEYPATPGSQPIVMQCYWDKEVAYNHASNVLKRRKDLKDQDVRVAKVTRQHPNGTASLLECAYR